MDLVNGWGVLCAKCLQWGHDKSQCYARIICLHCSAPGHKGFNCPSKLHGTVCMGSDSDNAVKSSQSGQQINFPSLEKTYPSMKPRGQPTSTVRCSACGRYGHLVQSFWRRRWAQRWHWRPKTPASTFDAPHLPPWPGPSSNC